MLVCLKRQRCPVDVWKCMWYWLRFTGLEMLENSTQITATTATSSSSTFRCDTIELFIVSFAIVFVYDDKYLNLLLFLFSFFRFFCIYFIHFVSINVRLWCCFIICIKFFLFIFVIFLFLWFIWFPLHAISQPFPSSTLCVIGCSVLFLNLS